MPAPFLQLVIMAVLSEGQWDEALFWQHQLSLKCGFYSVNFLSETALSGAWVKLIHPVYYLALIRKVWNLKTICDVLSVRKFMTSANT